MLRFHISEVWGRGGDALPPPGLFTVLWNSLELSVFRCEALRVVPSWIDGLEKSQRLLQLEASKSCCVLAHDEQDEAARNLCSGSLLSSFCFFFLNTNVKKKKKQY